MLRHRRIWLYGGRPFDRHKGLLRQESIALRRHFTLIARRRFRGILVMLWQRAEATSPGAPAHHWHSSLRRHVVTGPGDQAGQIHSPLASSPRP